MMNKEDFYDDALSYKPKRLMRPKEVHYESWLDNSNSMLNNRFNQRNLPELYEILILTNIIDRLLQLRVINKSFCKKNRQQDNGKLFRMVKKM